MKINIGPYIPWIGPYQIAEKILFWKNKDSEAVYALGKRLGFLEPLCQYLYSKRKRKVKIVIDHYDTWNADETLAMIALPLIKELKAKKQSSAMLDIADIPEEMQGLPEEERIHKAYEWFLDELIWTFEVYTDWDSNWRYDPDEGARVQRNLVLFGKYFGTLWT